MYYVFSLTIPANTTQQDPERQVCQLTHGVIKKVAVAFPPGPKGLAHLVIRHWEHQAWPTNPEASFAWDNYTIEFDEEFELDTAPYTLTLEGWNEDDTHEHTITVRVGVGGESWGLADLLALPGPVTILEGE
jgi:hypothetical protein